METLHYCTCSSSLRNTYYPDAPHSIFPRFFKKDVISSVFRRNLERTDITNTCITDVLHLYIKHVLCDTCLSAQNSVFYSSTSYVISYSNFTSPLLWMDLVAHLFSHSHLELSCLLLYFSYREWFYITYWISASQPTTMSFFLHTGVFVEVKKLFYLKKKLN